MVNVVSFDVRAASESDLETIESQEDQLSEIMPGENPSTHQSCVGDQVPKNSTEKKGLSKILIKSFGALTKIRGTRKNNTQKFEKFLSEISREKPIRYSFKQIKLFTRNFYTCLGMGGFGRVYKGELPNGVRVAVKLLRDAFFNDQIMSEVGILSRTYHRNIITLLGFCFEDNKIALVYEYMENGSLDQFIFSDYNRIDWGEIYHVAIETAKGISYLHEDCRKMIIHYDLKPSNILLDSDFTPKVSDFGLSGIYDRGLAADTSIQLRGTVGYFAPELIISPEQATYKVDIYSFGRILFDIVARKRNQVTEWFPEQIWNAYEQGNLETFLGDLGIGDKYKEQAKIMCMAALWCIQYIPENRPSMSTVVSILKRDIEVKEPPNPFPASLNLDSQMSSLSVSGDVQHLDYTQSSSGSEHIP